MKNYFPRSTFSLSFAFAFVVALTIFFSPQTSWALVNWWDKNDAKAQQYYREKDFKKALSTYKNFPTDAEHTPLLLHNMAMLKSHLGEKDAEKFFQKALKKIQRQPLSDEKKKQLADVYFNLAHHYFSQGFYEKAANAYRENLKLFPDNAKARHHLELALIRKQKKDQQKKKNNSQKKRSKKSTTKNKAQPSEKKQNKKKDRTEKNEQQKGSKPSTQKSKFSRQEAKNILKKIQQTDANKKDLRVYREVIGSKSSGKHW